MDTVACNIHIMKTPQSDSLFTLQDVQTQIFIKARSSLQPVIIGHVSFVQLVSNS